MVHSSLGTGSQLTMRRPTVQQFRSGILLFTACIVLVTTAPSGDNAQTESVPQNNENITASDLSSDTFIEVASGLPKRDGNTSTSNGYPGKIIPHNVLQQPANVNSVYESEFSNEITTLSNVIPRDPVIHNTAPAPQGPKPTEVIELQPDMKESLRHAQVDNSNMIENFSALSSSDSTYNEITESFQGSNAQEAAFTKLTMSSQDNADSQDEDVPSDTRDTVKLIRKLSEGPKDNQTPQTRDPAEDIFLKISLSSNGDSMMVNWLFLSNNTDVSGFQVTYRMDNREDFDSSSLDISVRSFALHSLHEDENYVICVHAIVNNTAVKSSCAEWSQTSMKMVVGILAGTIFLVPCIIIMVLILYKDHKMKQKNRLQEVDDEIATGSKQLLPRQNVPHGHLQSYHDEVKAGGVDKADSKTCPTEASLTFNSQKSLNRSNRDIGHENPCEHAADDSTDDDDIRGPCQRFNKQEVDMVSIPLHDELLSIHSEASVSSKNNVTYITIRSNSSGSKDRIAHQNSTQAENLSPSQDSIHL